MLSLFLAIATLAPIAPPQPIAIVLQARKAGPDFNPPDVLVPVSGFATFIPGADVKDVRYIALDGEEPFPTSLIGGDPKAFLFLSRGLPEKNYRFIGVASDKEGNLTQKAFAVRVGKPPVVVEPPKPKDPPAAPATFFFLVIRPDGPAAPAFTRTMSDPAWGKLRAAGHRVRDMTLTEAGEFAKGLAVPLPAVVTLGEDAVKSWVVRPGIALPATAEAILALPKIN